MSTSRTINNGFIAARQAGAAIMTKDEDFVYLLERDGTSTADHLA